MSNHSDSQEGSQSHGNEDVASSPGTEEISFDGFSAEWVSQRMDWGSQALPWGSSSQGSPPWDASRTLPEQLDLGQVSLGSDELNLEFLAPEDLAGPDPMPDQAVSVVKTETVAEPADHEAARLDTHQVPQETPESQPSTAVGEPGSTIESDDLTQPLERKDQKPGYLTSRPALLKLRIPQSARPFIVILGFLILLIPILSWFQEKKYPLPYPTAASEPTLPPQYNTAVVRPRKVQVSPLGTAQNFLSSRYREGWEKFTLGIPQEAVRALAVGADEETLAVSISSREVFGINIKFGIKAWSRENLRCLKYQWKGNLLCGIDSGNREKLSLVNVISGEVHSEHSDTAFSSDSVVIGQDEERLYLMNHVSNTEYALYALDGSGQTAWRHPFNSDNAPRAQLAADNSLSLLASSQQLKILSSITGQVTLDRTLPERATSIDFYADGYKIGHEFFSWEGKQLKDQQIFSLRSPESLGKVLSLKDTAKIWKATSSGAFLFDEKGILRYHNIGQYSFYKTVTGEPVKFIASFQQLSRDGAVIFGRSEDLKTLAIVRGESNTHIAGFATQPSDVVEVIDGIVVITGPLGKSYDQRHLTVLRPKS